MKISSTAWVIISMVLATNGCGSKSSSSSGGSTANIGVAATLDTATASLSSGELQFQGSEILLSSSGSASVQQCTNTGTTQLEAGPLDTYNATNPKAQGWRMYFTPTSNINLTAIQLYIKKTGTPTGAVIVNVYSTGSYPISTGAFESSSLTGSYALTTIPLSTSLTLSAGTQYLFWIFGDLPYASGGGGVWFQSMTKANCNNSNFGTFYEEEQSGLFDTGMSIDLHFMSPSYPTDAPTASFTGDSGTAGATWYPSTFAPSENPSGESGTLLYAVGASDTNSPTYSQQGLTKSQVLALANLTGRYVFVRASLQSSGFVGSGIGNVTINHTP